MSLRVIVVVLILANLISAIGVVHARYRHRQLFVELSRLEKSRDELNIEFSRLQLEQATWAESNRVDQIANIVAFVIGGQNHRDIKHGLVQLTHRLLGQATQCSADIFNLFVRQRIRLL